MDYMTLEDAIEYCLSQPFNKNEFKQVAEYLKKYEDLKYKEVPVGVHKIPNARDTYVCNNCGAMVSKSFDNYCHSCGCLLTVGVKL